MRRVIFGWLTLILMLVPHRLAAAEFRYERSLQPEAGGNRLSVDVPLLTGAAPLRYVADRLNGGLEDLRLYDSSGGELPYLLIAPSSAQPVWLSGSILRVAPTKENSGFEIDLGRVAHVDRLRLTGIRAPFLKRMRLEGSGDRAHWIVLVDAGTLFDLPDENLVRKEAGFNPSNLRYLRLRWDDRNSAPVTLPATAAARESALATVPPPARTGLSFARRSSEPGKSRFRIRLPGPGLPLNALELNIGGGRVRRLATVTEQRLLPNNEMSPAVLGSHLLQRTEQNDAAASDLRIPIARPETTELDLEVDDGDNPPLDVVAVDGEMLPLPWIFFESRGSEKVTARFGNAQLGAPHYDLEAVRGTLAAKPLGTAQWGERRSATAEEATPIAMLSPGQAGSELAERGNYRHARAIADGTPGLTAVALDTAVLAHSQQLRDLRIIDPQGRQVPYILEHVVGPLAIELPALQRIAPTPGQSNKNTRYQLTLPYQGLPPSQLVLHTPARVFQRRLSVDFAVPAKDARSNAERRLIASADWRHADANEPTADLVLSLPSLESDTLNLSIDEGDNAPLPIERPRLLLPSFRLRFFRNPTAGPLTLLYGNPRLDPPRYDLSLLAAQVLQANVTEVGLAAETAAAATAAGGPDLPRGIFWAALGAAVLVLLAVVARLMRTTDTVS